MRATITRKVTAITMINTTITATILPMMVTVLSEGLVGVGGWLSTTGPTGAVKLLCYVH